MWFLTFGETFSPCDVCAHSVHIRSTVPVCSVPPTGNVAENSAYVMLSRVTSLKGLAFIAPPALGLLRRVLDPDYMRFNKTIEDNAVKTYKVFKHLAPVPDTPVQADVNSSSSESDATSQHYNWDQASSGSDYPAPRRSPASARRRTATAPVHAGGSSGSAAAGTAPQQINYDQASSGSDSPMLQPSRGSALRRSRAPPQATRSGAQKAAATSSGTDNDLRPAPRVPLEAERSTANSYFTRLDPAADPDVMAMDIDEWFPPPAVPEAPEQRTGPVALSSLPSPPIPPKRRPQQARARRAAPLNCVQDIVIFLFASFCISGASTTSQCPG